jgi:DNA adenine methylase
MASDKTTSPEKPRAKKSKEKIPRQPRVRRAVTLAPTVPIARNIGAPDTSGRYLYYLGAKETIIDVVQRLVPHDAVRLIEPFTGSGALASGLAFRFKEIEASDLNAELVESHNQVIKDTDNFITTLDRLFSSPAQSSKWFYDTIRDGFNASENIASKAAFLVFMNRKGFKGLMRRNSKGDFNVPFWKERANEPLPASQIKEFADRLADKAKFSTRDFKDALKSAGVGDFCYLDPPYLAEQGKDGTFAEYMGAFKAKDHMKMARRCREAADRGATVVVSNHESEDIRRIYRSADRIYTLEVPRSLSDGEGKGDSSAREVLAVWLPSSAWFQSFVRQPKLGEKPDPFGHWADQTTLNRKVFKIAKVHGWLEKGADIDKITYRTFAESGRCLFTIARLGAPVTRRLALENPKRVKKLSLHLLEALIPTDNSFPPDHLLPEKEAAAILLDLATRLEKALDGHPLASKALKRILNSKAEHFVAALPEKKRLSIERLDDRYRALLDAVVARGWTFGSTACQRLLLYAELCQNRGSNNFIRICTAVKDGFPEKALDQIMPPLKSGDGKGIGAHVVIPSVRMLRMRKAVDAWK